MLTGSWVLTRSPWLALRRSARVSNASTCASANASLFHATRLRHTTGTESTENVSRQQAIAKGDAQVKPMEVFEDYADEYKAIASTSKPPRPSVLDIIDSTLPAMLPPASTDASAIFEDESSSEYSSILLSPNSKQSLNEAVLGLLAEEKYEDAYKTLVEMKHLGHKIHAHHAYEAAALATLDDMLRPSSSQMLSEHPTRFETFFFHIPSSRVSGGNRTFKKIRRRVLGTSLINMDLIIRFSLILIMKGYVNLVQKHTIPFITRFASSDICLQFVDDVIVTNKRYWLSQQPPDERNAIIQSWNLRSTTIHWLAFSNRIEEALSLLPRDGLPMDGFRLSKETHALLRFRLERSSKLEHHGLTSYVDSLFRGSKNFPVSMRTETCSDPKANALPARIVTGTSQTPMASIPATNLVLPTERGDGLKPLDRVQRAMSSDPSVALAASLKRLKNAYISSFSAMDLFTLPPSLKEVLSFFNSYLFNTPNKDGRAIALLRQRVLRLGRGPASHFLFAEMLHYHQTGQPSLVVETYVDHFYISALPTDDVLAHDHQARARRAAQAAGERDFRMPFRIGMRNAGLSQSNIRLWPASGHTSLVWHALVALAKDDSSILQLYQKLLQISTEGHSSVSTVLQAQASRGTPLVPPSTWHAKVPASAFTPFIRRILKTSNPTSTGSLGASLLGDIVRAGIKPNVHHLTEIAQFYAQHSDPGRAFMIMERMEATEKGRENEGPISSLTGETVSRGIPRSFPAPDIIFYCALLRTFIRCRNLADAEKVATRIETRYKTTLASNSFPLGQLEVIKGLRRDLGQLRESKKHEVGMVTFIRDGLVSQS